MLALKIIDIKSFMNHLIVNNTFDDFLMYETQIKGANSYVISGTLNDDFFDDDEKENIEGRSYIYWKEQKEIVYNIMKGKKLPVSLRFILMLDKFHLTKLIEQNNLPIREEDVTGLYLNLYYDKGELRLTTGVSVKFFSLDKTSENLWDDQVKSILKNSQIAYE